MFRIFFALCFCNVIFVAFASMEIMTTLGPVSGKLIDCETTGAYYYSFEGIPYAEPPVDDLRFLPPVLKRPWKKVLNATKPGNVCPQPDMIHSRNQMSEDCLFLNVFTPANFLNKKLPVMVFIHTGNFKMSSGNSEPIYGPQLLIREDMVVVTVNHRLGALGFLSLCREEASGNAGIKDIILALEVIQCNIRAFGGDPNMITIGGNGSGAAIALYLLLVKQAEPLFQRLLIHSASFLSELYIQYRPRDQAIALGKELGLHWTDDAHLLRQLRKVNAYDIVNAQEAIGARDPQKGFRTYTPFKATVEINCPTAVITRPPLESLQKGWIQNKEIMIGYNNQEGLIAFNALEKNPELIEEFNRNFELLIPGDIEYPYGSVERRRLASQIKNFYFSGGNITFVKVQNFIDLVSDSQFIYPIDKFVKLYKARKTASVYYYVFDGDEEFNFNKIYQNISYPGASHDDDIGYLFLTSATRSRYQSVPFTTMYIVEAFMHNLKLFMTVGNPTPNPDVNCWPDAGKDGFYLKSDSTNLAIFQRPLTKRIGFWDSVYREYYNWNKYKGPRFC